ncbi:hypothetical protein G7Y89_g7866 [Cudoniella acicularis]|uniref:Glucose-methanol-choline oxidoreductase N-terminal domain-containing protein n=1 Tax=Cudoniella acicularis TaxID=354080 RepID=A0A8H4W3E0_9HELO|nr:hypothetical protein G7Y89_g7866 [Cudoniella acicularis]
MRKRTSAPRRLMGSGGSMEDWRKIAGTSPLIKPPGFRKKISAYLAEPGITQAGFLREVAKTYPDSRKIQSKVLDDFLSKGASAGSTSVVFYSSYVFFEKMRIRDRKPKSKHRLEMEKLHPHGFETQTTRQLCDMYGERAVHTKTSTRRREALIRGNFSRMTGVSPTLQEEIRPRRDGMHVLHAQAAGTGPGGFSVIQFDLNLAKKLEFCTCEPLGQLEAKTMRGGPIAMAVHIAPASDYDPSSPPNSSIGMSIQELRSVYFFKNVTAPTLITWHKCNFWNSHVMSLAFSEPSVRHAIIAMSVAQEHMSDVYDVIQGDVQIHESVTEARKKFALEHYTKSVALLAKCIGEGGAGIQETAMINCIIFVTYNFMCADLNTAMSHLRSGGKIYDKWDKVRRGAKYGGEASLDVDLASMFKILGLYALEDDSPQPTPLEQYHTFPNLSNAKWSIENLIAEGTSHFRDGSMRSFNSPDNPPTRHVQETENAYHYKLKQWAFDFESLVYSINREFTVEEQDEITSLRGGTAGLAVANRLSEISSMSVAVIEAGDKVFNNPNVTNPNAFTVALETSIDWQYSTTNQTHADGRIMPYHSGKALGGTSTINGMTYIRAEKSQINTWGVLGNEGWSWDELLPYYKKSEDFSIPTLAQAASGATYDPDYHGEAGPLKVGFTYGTLNGSLFDIVKATWNGLGIPTNTDLNGGQVRGISVFPSTVDRDANLREDAAKAYYYPFQSRPNLFVFLNTTANKIVWEETTDAEKIASGVQVALANGTLTTLNAKREVIVSAGSLRSPAILELSGVGNPDILSKFNIPCIVPLPGVGENLQEQPNNDFAGFLNTTQNGSVPYVTYASLPDFLPSLSLPNRTVLPLWANKIANSLKTSLPTSTILHLLTIQYDLLTQQPNPVPDAEILFASTPSYGAGPSTLLVTAFWLLLPFSRGNIHIQSSDPSVYPAINPNFFLVDFDLEVTVELARFVRRFWTSEPIAGFVQMISPDFRVIGQNATDEVWGSWVKENFVGNSHPIATAAMMPKELGGVVDARLKVYGTVNVRVVDASVMPFQVSGHLSSTVYAIAEKAADMIKEDMGGDDYTAEV